ncbi:MAG: hypothetical protein ACKVS8_01665 [Phycisphaerales bacterium]
MAVFWLDDGTAAAPEGLPRVGRVVMLGGGRRAVVAQGTSAAQIQSTDLLAEPRKFATANLRSVAREAGGTSAPPNPYVIAWSGSMGEGLFEADPRTWGPRGWAALHAACDAAAPGLEASRRVLVLRTHARHVLSDPRACVKFLADRAGGPFAVLPDAASMIERSMLGMVEDHLDRLFAALGGAGIVGPLGCVLANVGTDGPITDGDGALDQPPTVLVPIHAGAVPVGGLIARWQRHLGAGVPVVLVGAAVEGQVGALAACGVGH